MQNAVIRNKKKVKELEIKKTKKTLEIHTNVILKENLILTVLKS